MSRERTLRAAAVRVPGSTSNLGSGFDTIGLALARHLTASFTPDDTGSLVVRRSGTLAQLEAGGALAHLEPGPDRDLVAAAFRAVVAEAGASASGVLALDSDIPVARGLGSSAAAVVAGFDLARAALGLDRDDDGAFRAAYLHEGHGDNAAPSAFGGLLAVVPDETGPRALPLPLSGGLGFAYAAPAEPLPTARARAVLPASVPHPTAVRALGRVTALVAGLASGDADLIRSGLEDELHAPYRLALIRGADRAVAAGYAAGAYGVTVSGAGSGLIAVCAPDTAERVALAMRDAFPCEASSEGRIGFAVSPDHEGLRRT